MFGKIQEKTEFLQEKIARFNKKQLLCPEKLKNGQLK